MKKLLAIIVLGLLLTSCSNKVDKAIEKCADAQTFMGSNTYLRTEFKKLLINSEYQETVELINKLKKIQERTNENYAVEKAKYNKKNPQPSMPSYEDVQKGYTLEIYNKSWDEWFDKRSKKTDELLAPWRRAKEEIIEAEKFQLIVIRKLVQEDLKKKSLKEKSQINKYNNNFEKCEKAQTQAPKSFMLEWSK